MGAIDYLTKPIHLRILRQRIKRIIEQSQLQKKLIAKNLELQRLVIIDELTQVANRRRFEEYLAQEWQRMAREQQPFFLIIWDVDFFKSYNHTYGHLSGDRCLKEIAKTIKNFLKRSTDLEKDSYALDAFALECILEPIMFKKPASNTRKGLENLRLMSAGKPLNHKLELSYLNINYNNLTLYTSILKRTEVVQ